MVYLFKLRQFTRVWEAGYYVESGSSIPRESVSNDCDGDGTPYRKGNGARIAVSL